MGTLLKRILAIVAVPIALAGCETHTDQSIQSASGYSAVASIAARPTLPAPLVRDQAPKFEASVLTVTRDAPVSTFSIDVDTTAYTQMRRVIREQGMAAKANPSDEWAFVKLRWKAPGEDQSRRIDRIVTDADAAATITQAPASLRFAAAAAAFAEKIRGASSLADYRYAQVRELAQGAKGEDPHGYRSEFLELVSLAELEE